MNLNYIYILIWVVLLIKLRMLNLNFWWLLVFIGGWINLLVIKLFWFVNFFKLVLGRGFKFVLLLFGVKR